MKVEYRASDGQIFTNAEECLDYERTIEMRSFYIPIIKDIKNICDTNYCDFRCPFWSKEKNRCLVETNDNMPCNWDI